MHCLTNGGSEAVRRAATYCVTVCGAVGSATFAMHCFIAWGQWAVELLQRTASLAGGSGAVRCPATHCVAVWGAVGSVTFAMHCFTAWGQRAVRLLQYTASLRGGSGQWNSFNALPHCLGWAAVLLQRTASLPGRSGQWDSCNTPRLTAWGQWAVELLQCTAAPPAGGGQCNSCDTLPHLGQRKSSNALPHCVGATGSRSPTIPGLTAWWQWVVELLQCTAAPPGGSGQWNSCKTPPHCLGAVCTETPVIHCLSVPGLWAMELLQCTAALPRGSGEWNCFSTLPHCRGGSGHWNSCNAPPHCLGAVAVDLLQYTTLLLYCPGPWALELLKYTAAPAGVNTVPGCLGSGSPAMHYPTARGQWVVELLQRTAWLPEGRAKWDSRNAPPHCLGGTGQWNSSNPTPRFWGQRFEV